MEANIRNKTCKFFQNGSCRLKNNCPYLHIKQVNKKHCKYFSQGHCRKGSECNFYHEPRQNQRIQQNQQQHPIQNDAIRQQKKANIQNTIKATEPVSKKPDMKAEEQQKRTIVTPANTKNAQNRINAINDILGLNKKQETKPKKQSINQLKNEPEPQWAASRKIVVTFKDLNLSLQGKQNIAAISINEFGGKQYLQYLKTLTSSKQKALAQMMRRYQPSFSWISKQHCQFIVKVMPIIDNKEMYLNFNIEEGCLVFEVDLSRYPKGVLKIVNKSIPEYFKEELNKKVIEILEKEKKGSCFQTLKYVQNYFEGICQQVDFVLENRKFSEKDLAFQYDGGFEEQKDEEDEIPQIRPVKNIKKVEEPPVGVHNQNPAVAEPEEQQVEVQNKKQKQINPQIELLTIFTVQTLETNCESLMVEEALVHLVCECEAMITYLMRAKGKKGLVIMSRLKCNKCKEILTVYMRRNIILRNQAERICEMGCIGGKIEQVGAVLWKVNCSCQNTIVAQELSVSGVKRIIKCFNCFREYFVQYYGMFRDVPGVHRQPVKFKSEAAQQGPGTQIFKLDTELPNKGICKHYKFSFRFFRFPCCGRAFPCDTCHEEKTQKHEWDRANVMICGMCSYEQPLADKCKRCKKELVKGAEKSGHWEGGKGCRNQQLLSKNDSKKYTGLTKTVANKKS